MYENCKGNTKEEIRYVINRLTKNQRFTYRKKTGTKIKSKDYNKVIPFFFTLELI